uniref:WD_REPEATS_REGION domain-containing protein n=1 Tax=Mesocestoides corti TaxID=53468 RepID=A0A5K3F3G5_MESCO
MLKKKGYPIKNKRKSLRGEDLYDGLAEIDGPLHPKEQLQLSDEALKEEITKVLTAANPHAPDNIVRFNFKENQYKKIPRVDQMAVHFQIDGNLINIESDEAKIQLGVIDSVEIADENSEDAEGQQEKEHKAPSAPRPTEKSAKKLVNQFNFCEHATQTYNNALKDHENQTEPPARGNFSGNITQWSVYDFYRKEASKKGATSKKKPKPKRTSKPKSFNKRQAGDLSSDGIMSFIKPIKTIERMINQNTFDDVLQDFAFYEDASDEFRDSLGTLLPLWKFTFEKSKKMVVTALSWSPRYNDLFAVGLGSHEFLKQVNGMICFYSLKNPGYPEYIFHTESGVLCLDVHPEYPCLTCVGFYDGSVGVFKLNQEKVGPLYLSTAYANKHTDPVWQVRWLCNSEQPNLTFFSIGSDGRVSCWSILKEDISCYDVLLLRTPKESGDAPKSFQISTYESGTALDFHRKETQIFLIGTEEGMVHKCSRTYGSQYLSSLKAHNMAVYGLAWNYFHDDIFITCSADWTVKIWHQDKKSPVFTFDLGAPVGDVAWSPYSSTVFAAVTTDGNVRVYDLNINKYEPLCLQMVTQKKRTKLTHVAFNPVHPVIICGDDRLAKMDIAFLLASLPLDIYS